MLGGETPCPVSADCARKLSRQRGEGCAFPRPPKQDDPVVRYLTRLEDHRQRGQRE